MRAADPELRAAFQSALANLPPLQRKVFELHARENLSYAEIGQLLRLSERSVERQLAQAIANLAKQMDGRRLQWWERLL